MLSCGQSINLQVCTRRKKCKVVCEPEQHVTYNPETWISQKKKASLLAQILIFAAWYKYNLCLPCLRWYYVDQSIQQMAALAAGEAR